MLAFNAVTTELADVILRVNMQLRRRNTRRFAYARYLQIAQRREKIARSSGCSCREDKEDRQRRCNTFVGIRRSKKCAATRRGLMPVSCLASSNKSPASNAQLHLLEHLSRACETSELIPAELKRQKGEFAERRVTHVLVRGAILAVSSSKSPSNGGRNEDVV